MDETNQGNGGLRKAFYGIVGVIAILVVLYFLRGVLGMNGEQSGIDVDRNSDGSATYSNDDGTVTVGGNTLPENWPSDAPTYANATIQYSGSSNPQTGEKGLAVVLMTSDGAQKVVDFYKRELASKGWTVDQTATMGASTALSAQKDTRTFVIYVADAGNGQVSITASIAIPDSQ